MAVDFQPTYQSNITVPNWMVDGMERVMQYYVNKNLRLDTISTDRMPKPIPGRKYMLYAHIPFCHTLCCSVLFTVFYFVKTKQENTLWRFVKKCRWQKTSDMTLAQCT